MRKFRPNIGYTILERDEVGQRRLLRRDDGVVEWWSKEEMEAATLAARAEGGETYELPPLKRTDPS